MSNPNQCAQILAEKQILLDSLITQKSVTGSYNTFAGECKNQQLRETVLDLLDDEHEIQANIFNMVQAHGWYCVEPADGQKIQQSKQKFTQMQ